MFQSFSNIEIIVVDNGSEDNSRQIIQRLAASDPRIRFIGFEQNKGQHAARKAGVLSAQGKYIMFMDADDHFALDACEIALKAIRQGYDIVYFNTVLIDESGKDSKRQARMHAICNGLPEGVYNSEELLNRQLGQKKYLHNVWNKIYKAGICKKAFSALDDGFYILGEDFIEFIGILLNSEKILKIPHYLYYHNLNHGITSVYRKLDSPFRHSHLLALAREACGQHQRQDLLPAIKEILADWSLDRMLGASNGQFLNDFNAAMQAYGTDDFVRAIIRSSSRLLQVADVMKFPGRGAITKNITLGVMLQDQALAARLAEEVSGICPDNVRIITKFISPEVSGENRTDSRSGEPGCDRSRDDSWGQENRIVQLYKLIKKDRIDILLTDLPWSRHTFISIFLAKLAGCDIALLHSSAENIKNLKYRDYKKYLKSWRKAADLLMLGLTASYAEYVFMRALGVNLRHINSSPLAYLARHMRELAQTWMLNNDGDGYAQYNPG